MLCAIYFTLMIGLYGIAFWLPTIVKAFGIKGYFGVGLVTAIPYGVAVIGMIFSASIQIKQESDDCTMCSMLPPEQLVWF